jgi:hypothetical protein
MRPDGILPDRVFLGSLWSHFLPGLDLVDRVKSRKAADFVGFCWPLAEMLPFLRQRELESESKPPGNGLPELIGSIRLGEDTTASSRLAAGLFFVSISSRAHFGTAFNGENRRILSDFVGQRQKCCCRRKRPPLAE